MSQWPLVRLCRPAMAVCLWSLCVAMTPGSAQDKASSQIKPEPAWPAQRADSSLLLDIAITPSRAVAVGEYGHVLLSQDRQHWEQTEDVPVRATLTAVDFVGHKGWAVGHDAAVIHSGDGGQTWSLQHWDPEWQLEHPLLDVHFSDSRTGFAIGAFGYFLRTTNGGEDWEQRILTGDEDIDWHLNSMTETADGMLFIAAEAGHAYRSWDQGQTWEMVRFPYEGSMFGVLNPRGNELLAYGLRGHILESTDHGSTWQSVPTATEAGIMGGRVLDDGTVVLVGSKGIVLRRAPEADEFELLSHPSGAALSGVAPHPSGRLIAIGENGLSVFSPQSRELIIE